MKEYVFFFVQFFLISHPMCGIHIGARLNSNSRRKVHIWGRGEGGGKVLPNKSDSVPKKTRTWDLLVKGEWVLTTPPQVHHPWLVLMKEYYWAMLQDK